MRKIQHDDVPESVRPNADIWSIIVRETTDSSAQLFALDDGSYAVLWLDEAELTPLEFLVYDEHLGMYDRRKFANIPLVGDTVKIKSGLFASR